MGDSAEIVDTVDTAAALGISVGTVTSHTRDALTRLRNQQSGDEQPAAKT